MLGIIMYGPPAVGKDTVTAELHRRAPRYRHFERLKVGPGRKVGYRLITAEDLALRAQRGDIIWQNEQYDALYAVDQSGIAEAMASGVPVVHLGQPGGVLAIQRASIGHWLVVSLWCPRDVAAERLGQRDPASVTERLAVWDRTAALPAADLSIDTGKTSPEDAAAVIDATALALSCAG